MYRNIHHISATRMKTSIGANNQRVEALRRGRPWRRRPVSIAAPARGKYWYFYVTAGYYCR